MNSDVWLNGHYLGNHPYGYTPFYYDLTPYLNNMAKILLQYVCATKEKIHAGTVAQVFIVMYG